MDNEEDRQRSVVERERKRKGRKRDYVSGKQLFESREREREYSVDGKGWRRELEKWKARSRIDFIYVERGRLV